MEVVYIPQLDLTSGGGGGAAGRYRLVKSYPDGARIALQDRCVTRVELKTADPVEFVFPPLLAGLARDFFLRLVITSDVVPEVTFGVPTGETFSFEEGADETFACEVGVNVFAFTEMDPGVFVVNRKVVSVVHDVALDPNGGEVGEAGLHLHLGSRYGALPKPERDGYGFAGWYTEPDGGIPVTSSDTVKSSVTVLFAHWEVYVDPFADVICTTGNLTFHTDEDFPWTVDPDESVSEPGAARSGAIADSGETALTATVSGPGVLSFKWKASSEQSFDALSFVVDGEEIANISGDADWAGYTWHCTSAGPHALAWRYSKDGSVSRGSDCGWVDDVAWTPEGS